jgi:hypothetical protein
MFLSRITGFNFLCKGSTLVAVVVFLILFDQISYDHLLYSFHNLSFILYPLHEP